MPLNVSLESLSVTRYMCDFAVPFDKVALSGRTITSGDANIDLREILDIRTKRQD